VRDALDTVRHSAAQLQHQICALMRNWTTAGVIPGSQGAVTKFDGCLCLQIAPECVTIDTYARVATDLSSRSLILVGKAGRAVSSSRAILTIRERWIRPRPWCISSNSDIDLVVMIGSRADPQVGVALSWACF
jgi:hypothetical protein